MINIKEILKGNNGVYMKKVKNIVVGVGICIICGTIVGGTLVVELLKKQINFTQEDAKEIALQVVNGDIVDIHKEVDDVILVYEVKVKGEDNRLYEVQVNSKYGTVDIDED